jgi:OmpA family/Thrombospondin type 3 repeat
VEFGMISKVKSVILTLIIVLYASSAMAQNAPPPDKLDILTIRPSLGKSPFLYVSGLNMPAHMEYGAQMLFSYAHNPFLIYNMENDALGSVRAEVVSMMAMAEIGGFIGISDMFLLGASMPVGFIQGNEVDNEGLAIGSLSSVAWGDFTLHGKGKFYKTSDLALGADLRFALPTGKYSENFTGEYWPSVAARGVMQWGVGKFRAVAELGMLVRLKSGETEFFDKKFKLGNQVIYGLGAAYEVIEKLNVTAEIAGRSGFSGVVHDHPIEGGVGVSYGLGSGISVQGGVNVGIMAGVGTPQFRAMVGVKWVPSLKDTDNDGIPDEEDKCPLIKEDLDGFEDGDGCPELDNDKDGIIDTKDKCPNKAEDLDSFEDEDGCPELDNDKDGIIDTKDNCPNAKGTKANKGCPANMIDSDDDGVSDAKDKCPKTPGAKSLEGCPADKYDSDKDGIMDDKDKCPKEKGTAKTNGCPAWMFDTDKDGVPDDIDICPGEKETINGVKDFDGCKDRGKTWYKFTQVKIMGIKRYGLKYKFPSRKFEWFDGKNGHGSKLTADGIKALGQAALFMKTTAFPKYDIMIFTDKLISSKEAMKVTQAQALAIKKYLISKRVSAKKLNVQAMGNELPVYKGSTKRKQKRNRRILFIIPE